MIINWSYHNLPMGWQPSYPIIEARRKLGLRTNPFHNLWVFLRLTELRDPRIIWSWTVVLIVGAWPGWRSPNFIWLVC